jgi:hypothetical protein
MADLRFTKCGLGITAAVILALSLVSCSPTASETEKGVAGRGR